MTSTEATTVKHTPGPWRITSQGLLVSSDNGMILSIKDQGSLLTDTELQANYTLIESAPEILEALELLYGQWSGDYFNEANTKAREAIAKAKGRA